MKLNNWMNLLRSGAIKGLIALGVTMVLICGKIDLSTGSQVGLSGTLAAALEGRQLQPVLLGAE